MLLLLLLLLVFGLCGQYLLRNPFTVKLRDMMGGSSSSNERKVNGVLGQAYQR